LLGCALLVFACRAQKSDERAAASASVRSPVSEAAPELFGVREAGLDRAKRLVKLGRELEAATRARNLVKARSLALDFRRAYRRVEPVACVLAPVGSSQLDVGDDDEGTGEQPMDVGLQAISDALHAEPVDFANAQAVTEHAARSARLVQQELEVSRFVAHTVGQGLSRSVFVWGRRLDGSASQREDEAKVDVMAAGAGLVEWSEIFAAAAGAKDRGVRRRLSEAAKQLGRWLSEHGNHGRNKLDGLLLSGELGGSIRSATVILGGTALPPFFPRHRTREPVHAEPVSIATFPGFVGGPPDPERAKLGALLFADTRLSQNEKLSCATCHQVKHGLAAAGKRPRKVDGNPVAREVPALYNVGFEPMLFWDGRASTLPEQAGIALVEDMSVDWNVVASRLNADADFKRRFEQEFPEGIGSQSVRAALGEFERTLVSDSTPFDRYVRGDTKAMDAELHAGFDIFFGKARCSRCHRLPLTSGAMPPRFRRTQVNVLGVPTKPNVKKLDPDLGRGGVTRKEVDASAFKTPGLRNLALTAPYFHNGAFHSLAEVVDFYAKGSGPGLGFDLVVDPDARTFELTKAERKALLAFLEKGLRDDAAVPR
jgi:cytochrome c peroxidase